MVEVVSQLPGFDEKRVRSVVLTLHAWSFYFFSPLGTGTSYLSL